MKTLIVIEVDDPKALAAVRRAAKRAKAAEVYAGVIALEAADAVLCHAGEWGRFSRSITRGIAGTFAAGGPDAPYRPGTVPGLG